MGNIDPEDAKKNLNRPLIAALNCSHNLTVIFPASIKPLESFALTAPLSTTHFFIVYQLLENFTL